MPGITEKQKSFDRSLCFSKDKDKIITYEQTNFLVIYFIYRRKDNKNACMCRNIAFDGMNWANKYP